MIHFIRLCRPVNLLIIALTMYSIAWYLDCLYSYDSRSGITFYFDFFVLVLSTVLIAAAGNIINDYFDIKADRINRPNAIIITKYIKPRLAIISHWTLNFMAFAMAVYLSVKQQSFWYVFIHLLSINLLWFYSLQLKRTIYIGNILIALLSALVPILVGVYYYQSVEFTNEYNDIVIDVFPFKTLGQNNYIMQLVISLALFAFFLSWSREIVKDMEDIEGDKKIRAKTIPIVFGTTKSKAWAISLLIFIFIYASFLFYLNSHSITDFKPFYPLMLTAFLGLFSIFLLIKSKEKRDFNRTQLFIKLIILSGLILPFWWGLLLSFS